MKKEFPKNNINMKKIILATTFVFALAGFSFAQNSHGTSEKQELNSKGQPVPLAAFATTRWITGPVQTVRYNGYGPSLEWWFRNRLPIALRVAQG